MIHALLSGSALGISLIWIFARSKIRFSRWFLTLSLCRQHKRVNNFSFWPKTWVEFQAILILFFELETITWNPNMALSQSRTSSSPAFCLCCSNEAGQFKPRVFERAETAALTWWGVLKGKLRVFTYYSRLYVPIFSICMCFCSTSSSCIMDWDAPAESRGRIL